MRAAEIAADGGVPGLGLVELARDHVLDIVGERGVRAEDELVQSLFPGRGVVTAQCVNVGHRATPSVSAGPGGRCRADRRGDGALPDPGSPVGNDQRDVGAGEVAPWGRMPGSGPWPGVWFEAVAVEVDSGPQPASAHGDGSGELGARGRHPCGPPSACRGRRGPSHRVQGASRPERRTDVRYLGAPVTF